VIHLWAPSIRSGKADSAIETTAMMIVAQSRPNGGTEFTSDRPPV
jgi:hypothetical protein